VTVDQTDAYPGDWITVLGTNLPAYAAVASITIGGIDVRPTPAPSTDTDGSFIFTIMVPGLIAGNHEVSVTIRGWPISSTAKTVLTVLGGSYNPSGNNASISVSPTTASVGAHLVVTGNDFPGYQIVSTLTVSGLDVRPTPSPSTDADGSFIFTIMVPGLSSGSYRVLAVIGDTERSTTLTVK